MAYKPFPFTGFGGLDLASAPDESACIDMLNVDLDLDGRIRSRDFFGNLVTTDIDTPNLFAWPGQELLVVSGGGEVRIYNSSGTAVAAAAAASTFVSAQPFGTTSNSYLYLAVGGAATIRRLTTAGVVSAPAGMPAARWVSRQAVDNRLVAANLNTNSHRVQFSNAGDAETWGANDYVDLDPGDGEEIVGAAAWGDLLFVFKETKFFVFYGNSTDASGNPVFNYRAVRHAAGTMLWTSGATTTMNVVAGQEGVYFVTNRGVFVTSGGKPREVSGPIRNLFTAQGTSQFTPGFVDLFYTAAAANGRIYFSAEMSTSAAASPDHIFVYDETTGQWMVWKPSGVVVYGLATLDRVGTGHGVLHFTAFVNNSPIYKFDRSYSSDASGTLSAYYRSGFTDMGIHDEKRIAEWDLWGTGTVDFKTSRDFGSLDSATSFTLGTSPAITRVTKAKAKDGTLISWQLSGSGAWSVQRVVARISHPRPSTSKTP